MTDPTNPEIAADETAVKHPSYTFIRLEDMVFPYFWGCFRYFRFGTGRHLGLYDLIPESSLILGIWNSSSVCSEIIRLLYDYHIVSVIHVCPYILDIIRSLMYDWVSYTESNSVGRGQKSCRILPPEYALYAHGHIVIGDRCSLRYITFILRIQF